MLVQSYTTEESIDEFLPDAGSVMTMMQILRQKYSKIDCKICTWRWTCGTFLPQMRWFVVIDGHCSKRGTSPKKCDLMKPDLSMGRPWYADMQASDTIDNVKVLWCFFSSQMTLSWSFEIIQVCQDAVQMMNQPASLWFLWQSNVKYPDLHDSKYRHLHYHRTIKSNKNFWPFFTHFPLLESTFHQKSTETVSISINHPSTVFRIQEWCWQAKIQDKDWWQCSWVLG